MTHYQRLEYQREYNKKHKEQLKAYYQSHKEYFREYSKKYYREHKDQWTDIYIPRQIIKNAKSVDKN